MSQYSGGQDELLADITKDQREEIIDTVTDSNSSAESESGTLPVAQQWDTLSGIQRSDAKFIHCQLENLFFEIGPSSSDFAVSQSQDFEYSYAFPSFVTCPSLDPYLTIFLTLSRSYSDVDHALAYLARIPKQALSQGEPLLTYLC
ncbi:hypothetical protein IW261DRAFT_1556986 [Armillaria novae-zelandiae]|uniref:Uncharacterized protein n=1 Tax=Armillaria novae-zelandiae TaxID=153914 RepID=A0AA39PQ85_9AGAR|nr:hypothetical protein IW261DRAFT_1556986 [Armillaria novae-zelandiae]